MMNSKLSRWCDGFLEAGWLLALVVTPLFFNIHSERVFEPDKLTLLRSIALMMALVWLVKFIEQQGWRELDWLKWGTSNSIWRKPLVLPVLFVAVVYITSTLLSVAPRTSLWGSYQRLQGTYTTFSYIVIFAVIASTMRTRAQMQRLITTVIVTSIPVALYGILQRFELDPLPWGGDTSTRVAGHMGNAIFIAAYLIMAVPFTAVRIIDSFYNILTDEELAYADVVRSSIYILTIALQIIAIYFSQSRGPLLGLGVGLFAFVLLLLVALRNAAGERFGATSADYLLPLLYFILAIVALFITNGLQTTLGARNAFYLFVGLIGLLVLSIFVFAGARVGWRWLWASWLMVVLFSGVLLVTFNISSEMDERFPTVPVVGTLDTTFNNWRSLPTISRLGDMLNQEAGTTTVRILIWRGAIELIKPHDPVAFPDGETDTFNFLRPLFGYGPESMYVAYNGFYPPELATVEARNASPDRSHNETFDALVITGVAGFVAWQALYLAAFYYSFKRIGVVRGERDRGILIGLWIAGAAVSLGVIASSLGWEYLGVAIPFGSIIGLVVYLVYYALTAGGGTDKRLRDYDLNVLIVAGLIAALIAFYMEIHFGIAIAATRLHSFAFFGMIFVLSTVLRDEVVEVVSADPVNKKRRRSVTPKVGWGGAVWAAALVMSFVVITLMFDFINYTPTATEQQSWRSAADLPSSFDILTRALLVNPKQGFIESPYLLGVITLSWFFGMLLFVTEMIKSGTLKLTRPISLINADKRMIVSGLLGALALIGIASYFLVDVQSNSQRIGVMLSALWVLLTVGAAIAQFAQPALGRGLAAAVAATGILFSLPLLMAGVIWQVFALIGLGIALLYIVWEDEIHHIFSPLLIIGGFSFVAGWGYALAHASLIRSNFIAPNGANGAPLQGLERIVTEAERAGGYLTTYYSTIFLLLLIASAAFAWRRMAAQRELGSAIGLVGTVVLLIVGFVMVDQSNLNIVQADMTYKRGRPLDQQATQLVRRVNGAVDAEEQQQILQGAISSWEGAVAIYERTREMAPNEDFYYLWLGRAYLEQSSVNQAEQDELLQTAEERLLDAQDLNPLNTDHTANLARLNVRWAQLADTEAERTERVETAAAFYRDALKLSPNNSIIRNEYAGLTLSLGDNCEDALGIYREAVEIDPLYDQSYLAMVEAYISCAQRSEPINTAYLVEADQVIQEMLDLMALRYRVKAEQRIPRFYLQIAQLYFNAENYGQSRATLAKLDGLDEPELQAQIDQLRAAIDSAENSIIIETEE